MKIVKTIPLAIFDSEIGLYNKQKADFEKAIGAPISDEQFVRTFIYSDVIDSFLEKKERDNV